MFWKNHNVKLTNHIYSAFEKPWNTPIYEEKKKHGKFHSKPFDASILFFFFWYKEFNWNEQKAFLVNELESHPY